MNQGGFLGGIGGFGGQTLVLHILGVWSLFWGLVRLAHVK
jgi:hypothetical protein